MGISQDKGMMPGKKLAKMIIGIVSVISLSFCCLFIAFLAFLSTLPAPEVSGLTTRTPDTDGVTTANTPSPVPTILTAMPSLVTSREPAPTPALPTATSSPVPTTTIIPTALPTATATPTLLLLTATLRPTATVLPSATAVVGALPKRDGAAIAAELRRRGYIFFDDFPAERESDGRLYNAISVHDRLMILELETYDATLAAGSVGWFYPTDTPEEERYYIDTVRLFLELVIPEHNLEAWLTEQIRRAAALTPGEQYSNQQTLAEGVVIESSARGLKRGGAITIYFSDTRVAP